MSKLIIKNNTQTELSIEHTSGSGAKSLGSQDFKYIRDTIKDLSSITPNDGDVCFIKGYHNVNDNGGGIFVYNANEPKINHNGGTIIDPDKVFPDWSLNTDVNTWFTGDGVGNGCWIRQVDTGYINPECFGAKGDGSTNDTKAIQQSIDNFGKIELLNKKYLIHSIDLNPFCEIRGNVTFNAKPVGTSGLDDVLNNYSTFLCVDETNPAIIMHNSSKLNGVSIFYPNQDRTDATNIITYPPTIKIYNGSFDNNISNILAINPYWLIDASEAHQILTVENVYGSPLYRGIFTDESYGIDRFFRVHFNPNIISYGANNAYRDYIWHNLIAFQSGKLDWGRWENCFVYGANIGYLVKTENTNDEKINQTTFDICGADSCKQPFVVAEDPNGHAVIGLKVVNCDFVARNPQDVTEPCNAVTLYNIKDSIFENNRIWGTRGHGFVLYRGVEDWWGVSISNNKIVKYGIASQYDGNVYDAIHIETSLGDTIIKNNYIIGNTGGEIYLNGIMYYETPGHIMQKSIISNNVLLGIFETSIDLNSTQVTECIVDNNICAQPKVNSVYNYLRHTYKADKEFTYFTKDIYRTSDLSGIAGSNLDGGVIETFKTLTEINNSFSSTDLRFLSFGVNDDYVFIRAKNLKLHTNNGNLYISNNLPTSDPGVAGQVYLDSNNNLKLSQG